MRVGLAFGLISLVSALGDYVGLQARARPPRVVIGGALFTAGAAAVGALVYALLQPRLAGYGKFGVLLSGSAGGVAGGLAMLAALMASRQNHAFLQSPTMALGAAVMLVTAGALAGTVVALAANYWPGK